MNLRDISYPVKGRIVEGAGPKHSEDSFDILRFPDLLENAGDDLREGTVTEYEDSDGQVFRVSINLEEVS